MPRALAAAHATSIGGVRPKALLLDGRRHLIAKFSSSADTPPVVKAKAGALLQNVPGTLRELFTRLVVNVNSYISFDEV